MEHTQVQNKKLTDEPGVYFFKKGRQVLYIGKATSLRDRVRSYFRKELTETRGQHIAHMVDEATNVTWRTTDSVLEALILEAHLIKQYQPTYNTKDRDNKSFNYVVITEETWPRVMTVRGRELDKIYAGEIAPLRTKSGKPSQSQSTMTILSSTPIKKVFGPFTSGGALQEALKLIRKIFPYRDRKCTPADEQRGTPKPCFSRQVGLCPGVCTGEISRQEYLRLVRNITLFFEGKKGQLLATLEKEMNNAARDERFEDAAHIRNMIYALNHINDTAMLTRDFLAESGAAPSAELFRIEAYDVAHFAGTSQVGVMTVFEDGDANTSEYRTFRIKKQIGGDDVNSLKEIIERRAGHPEWRLPNVIVVDGAQAQKNAAERVLAERGLEVPVIAVRKDERHNPRDLIGPEAIIREHRDEILKANQEAHRFAIEYHRRTARRSTS